MKPAIILCLLLIFLPGCQREAQPSVTTASFEAELLRLEEELTTTGAKSSCLQLELARWYNFQLTQGVIPPENTYNSILFYTDGILGSVEIPSLPLHQPIYHDNIGTGFGHAPTSPFPIGETGTHSILTTEESLPLAVGDQFLIHILDKTLTYRITAIRTDWDTTAVPGVNYCSILIGDTWQILGIREDG